jgi:CRP-like cAMP-binding protein
MSILSNSPNHCLSSLSSQDAELLHPHLKLVDLPAGTILYRANDKIARIYLPYTGIVSFVVGVTTGEFVEAGVIGRNGAVDISALLDDAIAINEAMVPVAMTGATVDVGILKELVTKSVSLRATCTRHQEMTLAQVQQIAACNALHSLQQRLARWLLQAHDLVDGDVILLTQEMLSQMLGVNRSTLTLAAQRLQEAGLIEYRRGQIRLLDIDALKDVSCECYAAINAHFRRLTGWSPAFLRLKQTEKS